MAVLSGFLKNKPYEPDKRTARLHHRLVYVQRFPNGNGRHARMTADLLISRLRDPALDHLQLHSSAILQMECP